MNDAAIAVFNGLTLFSILALGSLGLSIVFGLMRIVNMAHGELLAIGAYSLVLVEGWGGSFWLAVALAPILGALTGMFMERFLIRAHHDNPVAIILSTWGISLVLQQVLQLFFGRLPHSVSSPISGTVDFLGTTYPSYRFFLILAAVVLVAATLAFRRSQFGANLRALIQDRELARSLGVDVVRTSQITFILAAALTALCGALIAPQIVVVAQLGVNYLARSFVVVIVGGVSNPFGLVIGSGLLGGVETALGEFEIPSTVAQALVLFAVILVVKLKLNFRVPIGDV